MNVRPVPVWQEFKQGETLMRRSKPKNCTFIIKFLWLLLLQQVLTKMI